MKDNLKSQIVQALIDQKEIFGDELLQENLDIRKTKVVNKNSSDEDDKENLFEAVKEDWEVSTSLTQLNDLICNCTRCALGLTRKSFVFGKGNPNAEVMLVGEGPGAEEDLKGEPFVGRAGELLTKILAAINFTREEVFIANIVKCRPPGNRVPLNDEIDTCFPYLKKQIELINPKAILCLGATASFGLLKKKESLGNMRGKVFQFHNAKVMVTYHPAALLRNPNWKKGCWEDVQQFRKLYDEMK